MTIDRSDHRPKGKVSFPTVFANTKPVPMKPRSIMAKQKRLDKSLSMDKGLTSNNTRIKSPGRGWKRLNDG